MTDIVIVYTTVADDERAEQLARRLVDERLAACVNLHPPMVSMYRWRGTLERDNERQMVIKTTRDRLPALEARLTQLHAYELPEFLVVSADSASEPYLKWIKEATGTQPRSHEGHED
jgi:periplasmic divalent cation tolerance protein